MTKPMKKVQPSPTHEAVRQDLISILGKYRDQISAQEMLDLASYFVGQLIALQDQRRMTSADAIELVKKNMVAGNQDEVAQSLGVTWGNA